MDLPNSLVKAVDEFIEAWEQFLLDDITTLEVTDYIIRMLKVKERDYPESDIPKELFEEEE